MTCDNRESIPVKETADGGFTLLFNNDDDDEIEGGKVSDDERSISFIADCNSADCLPS